MTLLAGLRVLDFSRVMSGPYCTALLADLGADVIKVESIAGGDDARAFGPFKGGESVYFAVLNRGKRSIALDLKHPEGRALALALAAECDVVIENFRPGVAARLGVDAATLRARDPRLVHLSLSGFGQQGPYAGWPAYDLVVQAMSGLMSTTGDAQGPPTAVGESVADVWAGMCASWALLAALLHRERTGEGQAIDLAMTDALLAMQLTGLSRLAADGRAPQRVGNRHPATAPVDTYRTSDGTMALVVPGDAPFARLCELLGEPALAADARYASNDARRSNAEALKERIERWSSGLSTDAAVARAQAAGLPAGPVLDLKQALETPQSLARGVREELPHPVFGTLPLVRQPARFSGAATAPARREPALGEHTAAVLHELLGIDEARLDALRAAGAVGAPRRP